ncbi:hypothetical protein [Microbacterium lacusdiani]
MRARWELLVETEPADPVHGLAQDVRFAEHVLSGARRPLLRLWQPDRAALLVGSDAAVPPAADGVVVARRATPGEPWPAPATDVILWSVIAPRSALSMDDGGNPLDAVSEWALSSLRQLGMQASLAPGGAVMTPMGPVGACAVVERDGVLLGQGIIDYAIRPADRPGHEGLDTENVRSQSGLPLPLVIDRFARMARTLHLAAPVSD